MVFVNHQSKRVYCGRRARQEKCRGGWTDGQTDRQTLRWTDGPTDLEGVRGGREEGRERGDRQTYRKRCRGEEGKREVACSFMQ